MEVNGEQATLIPVADANTTVGSRAFRKPAIVQSHPTRFALWNVVLKSDSQLITSLNKELLKLTDDQGDMDYTDTHRWCHDYGHGAGSPPAESPHTYSPSLYWQ